MIILLHSQPAKESQSKLDLAKYIRFFSLLIHVLIGLNKPKTLLMNDKSYVKIPSS